MKDLLPRTETQIISTLVVFIGLGGFFALAIWGVFPGINIFIAAGLALVIVTTLYVWPEIKRALRVSR